MSFHPRLAAGACLLLLGTAATAAAQPATAPPSAPQAGEAGPLGSYDGAWVRIAPAGTTPAPRRDMGVAYDSRTDRLIMVGGNTGDANTWILSLSEPPAWSIACATPSPVAGACVAAVYDADGHRVVAVSPDMQVWSLDMEDPTVWASVPLASRPPPRLFFASVHDQLRNRLILFGGGPTDGNYNDVWALSLSGTPQWTQIVTAGTPPAPRWGASAAYDAVRDRLIVVAGSTSTTYNCANDVWALTLGETPTWSALSPSGSYPVPRMLAAAAYDPNWDRLILHGGYDGAALGDTWELPLTGTPEWSRLLPEGTPPAARWSMGVTYRSLVQPGLLVFGGFGGGPGNDVWTLLCGAEPRGPMVSGFTPAGGRIGDQVTVAGTYLENPLEVQFNGVSAPILDQGFFAIVTAVPEGATTGPIRVVTEYGSAVSAASFFVGETPVVESTSPDSGKVGTPVEVRGRHFVGATKVSFGGSGSAPFEVQSDSLLTATVDTLASTGTIRVTTPAATGASAFEFLVIADNPRPALVSVRDVAGDQGGQVFVSWLASEYDQPRYKVITGYRVWRRAPATRAAGVEGPAPDNVMVMPTLGPDGTTGTDFWEALVELPAAFLPGYAYVARTLQDSTAAGTPYAAYVVQAVTADPYVFYFSGVDSGYSVDNLAPAQPALFAATYAPSGVGLHWRPSGESDLGGYRLYRGTSAAFMPGPANLISTQLDTTYYDPEGTYAHFYKLAAVDVHGNESRFALATPEGAVGTLATLLSAEVEGLRVRLRWSATANPGLSATVYRRDGTAAWTGLGQVTADGTGLMEWTDEQVTPGREYGYRLGVWDAGTEVFLGEVWVEVPVLSLALVGVRPNPSRGDAVVVTFSLPDDRAARLELFDLAGRRLAGHEVGALGPGQHRVDVAPGTALPAGVYVLRLTQGPQQRSLKAVVVK